MEPIMIIGFIFLGVVWYLIYKEKIL